MQDIDFDELDRAVSSVSNAKPAGGSAKKDDTDTVAVKVSSPAPVSPRPDDKPSTVPPRSAGRFMDMVHPTSDMRKDTPATDRLSVPERPQQDQKEDQPETPAGSFEWPDPIDVAGTHSDMKEEKPVEPEEAPVAKPLESPFLNDTKVEKRPLGAFSDAAPAPALDTSLLVDEEVEEKKEAPKKEDDAQAEAIKTEALIQEAKAEEASTENAQPPEKPVDDAPVGPTSITQQYKEQPSTTDQPSGAVFDTEEYHKPLSHPSKKRSSVAIILWIIALILIGGGIGAAIYFFVLPLL